MQNDGQQKFGFLVHARTLDDLYKKFPFLEYLPKSWSLSLTKKMPTIPASRIEGLHTHTGRELTGYIFGLAMTAHQMMEERELAQKKIRESISFAEKKGIELVGLGALTASLSYGGKLLSDANLSITTGRTYTIITVANYIKKIIKDFPLDKKEVAIGVVGASGAIGSGCAQLLDEWGVNNFILIDLERKIEKLEKKLHNIRDDEQVNVSITHQVSEVKRADIIIAATNAPEAVIHAEYLSRGAIVVNDAQPSDVGDDVYHRDDVLVIEGGVIHTPGINYNFDLGLASEDETFCCLGEVMILAHNDCFENYSLGEPNLELISDFRKMANKLDFNLANYQNINGYIPKDKLNRIKEILKKH